jgi:hypothetical protein
MNHYFADNLRKAREDRIKKQLVNLQSWTINNSLKQPLLCLKDTITTFLNNEDIYNNLLIIVKTPNNTKDSNLPSNYNKEKGVVYIIRIRDLNYNIYIPLTLVFLTTNIILINIIILTFLKLYISSLFYYIILSLSTLRTISYIL